MKIFSLVVLIAFSFFFISCNKNKAGDIADEYVGLYQFTDTVVRMGPTDTITTYPVSTGLIAKQTGNTVLLNNFSAFICDSVTAQVNETTIVLTSSNYCQVGIDFPVNFIATKRENTIYYHYTNTVNPMEVEIIRGKAVMQ
ncbi:MAG TPA: hypothetical protein PL009_05815 [Flavipsychrobacter sp.]|nr:hypothetical protein [Flavipsychrobacter sp.]